MKLTELLSLKALSVAEAVIHTWRYDAHKDAAGNPIRLEHHQHWDLVQRVQAVLLAWPDSVRQAMDAHRGYLRDDITEPMPEWTWIWPHLFIEHTPMPGLGVTLCAIQLEVWIAWRQYSLCWGGAPMKKETQHVRPQ